MDTPDTHPSMCLLKVKIDAAKLSVDVDTIGGLVDYLIGSLYKLSSISRPLGPHIEPIKDAHGVTVGEWQIQDGRQPY